MIMVTVFCILQQTVFLLTLFIMIISICDNFMPILNDLSVTCPQTIMAPFLKCWLNINMQGEKKSTLNMPLWGHEKAISKN